MDFSTPRTTRMSSIASTASTGSDLSRTSSLQREFRRNPLRALRRRSRANASACTSRASIASAASTIECPLSPQEKALVGLPSTSEEEFAPPSYEDSTRQTFKGDRSRSIDSYGNEWRCRLGVWYMVRPSGPRKSSTRPSDAPVVINGKDWRKKFGVWYASRQ